MNAQNDQDTGLGKGSNLSAFQFKQIVLDLHESREA